jgi:cation-transporting P-type ATPase C
VGEATTLGRIATLVHAAEVERAPIVRIAARWATWFTPAVLLIAGLTFLVRHEALPAVSVLVVACPCALVLATPTAIVAGIARGAKGGILLRGGGRLEAAGHIDTVCLDKTGTLTVARPSMQRIVTFGAYDELTVLGYAAAAERFSEHPLATAVLDAATERNATVPAGVGPESSFESIAGRGVRVQVIGPDGQPVTVTVGQPDLLAERHHPLTGPVQAAIQGLDGGGHTPVVVALDHAVIGVIGISDAVRPEAAEALADLKAGGITRIILLTGDRAGPALVVARQVGIDASDVFAQLLPEQKLDRIKQLRAEGHRVAMVGDGVNDAPALAAADIAIAMGGTGTDLALSTADIVLMSDDLRQVGAAITLSRKTLTTIWQNLGFAAAWNGIAIVAVTVLTIGPAPAALIHNVGSVAVVLNAARLINTGQVPRLDRGSGTVRGPF